MEVDKVADEVADMVVDMEVYEEVDKMVDKDVIKKLTIRWTLGWSCGGGRSQIEKDENTIVMPVLSIELVSSSRKNLKLWIIVKEVKIVKELKRSCGF